MSTVETTPIPVVTNNDGDHEKFAHWVIGGGAEVLRAMVTGEPCTALCGKRWVPSRDPKNYPVCPECEEIANANDVIKEST